MKIVRYRQGRRVRYGILDGALVKSLENPPYRRIRTTSETHKLEDVRFLAPCVPSKIVALGLNYRSHATEFKISPPDEPLIFLKPSTSVIGPEENIIYPPSSHQVDYEGELGVVIKSKAWQISREDAPKYILGYTCFNDVTARDLQRKDKQWTRAKGFDTFAAIGPCIETEINPSNASVETYQNGELKQKANISDLVFPVFELVSFISHVMTLLPGDVIATGTPSGIGPMQKGDTIEIKIEPIGTLRNYVT